MWGSPMKGVPDLEFWDVEKLWRSGNRWCAHDIFGGLSSVWRMEERVCEVDHVLVQTEHAAATHCEMEGRY